ncbi:FHS family L-fucose permease-like MFS transporter [Sphingomonas naasensis]|uniref:Glucose/galactose MFS transporter n=1 Tax=Sphingomonas naasensis TaxID=1344951 RepID=A0A4S1WNJ1_9SPHN|nr:sugar MFS transporter [Sphingomonas naasensis]NIJ20361.1 FHS family L-fucose permease-like MFS transporter [Sphingomonas naasensis]TGX44473.1 glucose/galactose MFS transporter [Sphingomonas naasensis]
MTSGRGRVGGAFAPVTALFFAWGFVSANNDPLIAAMRAIFHLSYTAALFTQIVSFVAFATMSLPLAWVLGRVGALRTILAALATMLLACLILQGTALVPHFALVLAGLFVLASGVVGLQVAANPLAALLGPPERSAFRLTLAHGFNALGMVCGVHFGARLILGSEGLRAGATQAAGIGAVSRAFLIIAAILLGLVLLVALARRQIAAVAIAAPAGARLRDALHARWALLGAGGIALYVGAEVTIGSLLILYLAAPQGAGLSLADAGARVASFYWGGALVGRFAGSWALRHLPAARLLAAAATVAAALCAGALLMQGPSSAWCLMAVGLFNSVMFPAIFALTLERSTASASATSGLLCAAIGAGAVVPLLAGQIADRIGLHWSFAVALLAYCYILGFAVAASARRAPQAAFLSR